MSKSSYEKWLTTTDSAVLRMLKDAYQETTMSIDPEPVTTLDELLEIAYAKGLINGAVMVREMDAARGSDGL